MVTAETGWKCTHKAEIVSETGGQAKIKVTCYWQNNGWYYEVNGISAWVYCNGKSAQVKDNSWVDSSAGADSYLAVSCGSYTFTIDKTTSAQSISCYAKIQSNSSYSGYYTRSSTAAAVSVAAKTKYAVKYNANGGSGEPSAQTKWYGTALTLSSTKPSYTGRTFQKWNHKKDGSGVSFNPGGRYTYNASATLYAQWVLNTYAVKYNANGGSGAPSAQTKTYGKALTLSSTKPTRTGYTFKGWGTSASDTSADYQAGGSYTANKAITLYAIWTLKTYTIAYNANEGAGAPSSQTKTYGKDLTLSSTKPTRTGYTFQKWNTKSNGSGTSYAAGATYTADAAATLYAQWKINTYTIKYNANGGSNAPGSQTKTYGKTLTLTTATPTYTGYTFQKWNTKADGSGDSYSSGASYTANTGATLYAQWTKTKYTIKYDANGGSGAPSNQTKTHGTDLTLSATKPTRTGYNFKEWNTKSDGSGNSYASGAKYTTNAAATLYAIWVIATYTVKYNANGGSGAPSNQTKTHGTALTLSSTKPTRTGYKFQKWTTKSDGSGSSYVAGASYTANEDATLYAQWKADTYTITYDANGGSGAPSNQTKTYGVALTLSVSEPTRASYAFAGWNTKSDGSGTDYSSGDTYTANTGVTLYAQWTLSISACGQPTAMSVTANDDNTITFSCKVGSDGVGNKANGVELFVYFTSDTPTSGKHNYTCKLTGTTSTVVSKTISFTDMPKNAIVSYLGNDCKGLIQFTARTLGGAGKKYYSAFTDVANAELIWHESPHTPTVTKPVATGDTWGLKDNYRVTWTCEEGGANNDFLEYSLRVYDETAKTNKATYNTKNQYCDINSDIFTKNHSYRFYIQAKGTAPEVPGNEAVSGSLLIKDIKSFPQAVPSVIHTQTSPSTTVYNDLITFIDLGFGSAMKASWVETAASENILSHYVIRLVQAETQEAVLAPIITHGNEFYFTSDMLKNCPRGVNKLNLYVDAISSFGEPYSTYMENPVVFNYAKNCTGVYTRVSDRYAEPIMKRAIAFVKVPKQDGTNESTWKLAERFFVKDPYDSWQPSDIQYEVLVDEDGEIILDADNNPIYTL